MIYIRHRLFFHVLTVSACLYLYTPASLAQQTAQDRWYDIELLLFKYTQPDEFPAERWPQRWLIPQLQNSVNLNSIDSRYRADFQLLAGSAQSFGGMLERIKKSSRYEILDYSSWRQRGLDKAQAIGIQIRAGRKYLPQAPLDRDSEFGLFEQSYFPEPVIRRYSEVQSATGSALYELEGEIKIVLSRYLHVYADLLMLKPVTLVAHTEEGSKRQPTQRAPTAESTSPAYRIAWADKPGENETLYGFNIKSHRRMRSGELHHLDHPLLGILIQIKPVETKKP